VERFGVGGAVHETQKAVGIMFFSEEKNQKTFVLPPLSKIEAMAG
jgi:hypothetical protein